MRDLYKRLGISVDGSESEIRTAITKTPHAGLRKDAEVVLLDSARRRVYDRIHAGLSDVGKLRARLGLNHSENWKGPAASDFSITHDSPRSLYDELIAKVNTVSKAAKRAKFVEQTKSFLQVFGVLGALFGLFWLIVIFGDGGSLSNPLATPSSSSTASRQVRPQPSQPRPDIGQQTRATAPTRPVPSQPIFTAPEQPLPYNGKVIKFTQLETIAPFEIKSSTGSHYLVKLADAYSDSDVLTVFVHGGSTVQIDVPLGTYIVKYAAGTKWYGYKHLFGPETSYSKADETFRFERNGYQVTGYTITLYTVLHGNLQTSTIRPEDF